MGQRLQLQTLLEETLGSSNVYFQPPENLQIQYPCIVYSRDGEDNKFADNAKYKQKWRWMLTVIDLDPDSDILDRVSNLPMCTFDRWYPADNLNHNVFTIYF